jgi:hypothetical protein
MSEEIVCTAALRVEVPPDEALSLFTPEGEREWVEGWHPTYPAGLASDKVGTVFVTGELDHATYWVIVESTGTARRYARVTPGRNAGVVEVKCERDGAAATRVDVTYRLTALSTAAAAELREFEAGYEDYIAGWESAIATALARR